MSDLEQAKQAFPVLDWTTDEEGNLFGTSPGPDVTICDLDGWKWMVVSARGAVTQSQRDFATLRECLADLKTRW